MKRFLVVLVVLAGGLAWAAFGVPTDAATVNGVAISQNQLNSDLSAIAVSPDYQCYLAAQEVVDSNQEQSLPDLAGAGQATGSGSHPSVTAAYVSYYLDTDIGHQILLNEAAKRHLQPTATGVSNAKTLLVEQITQIMSDVASIQSEIAPCAGLGTLTGAAVLKTVPASFVHEITSFDATIGLLEAALTPTTTADESAYYSAHRSNFDTVCFTIAGYSSQSDAETAYGQVQAGTSFANVAAAAETGSGPQGCLVLNGLASELSSVVDLYTLKTNTVTQPFANNGSYLLLEFTSRKPTSFAKAATAVKTALEEEGGTDVGDLLHKSEAQASISVNPRYGSWKEATAQIILPPSPAQSDVPNFLANDPLGTTAAAASGAATPAAGKSG